jgi:regulatory protein
MITIVKILYKNDHVRVELDSGEKFDLDPLASSMYRLDIEKVLSQEEYTQLKDESDRFMCGRKAINYIAMGSKSSKEVVSYLKRKGFDSICINEAIEKLKNLKYLDDMDYAERFAKQKLSRKTIGKNLIKQDLIRKGIPRDIIKKVISGLPSDEAGFEKIYQAALKKYNSVKNKPNPIQKVYMNLISKGFDSNTVLKVINNLKKNLKSSEEENINQ